jgi:hypothetical protein
VWMRSGHWFPRAKQPDAYRSISAAGDVDVARITRARQPSAARGELGVLGRGGRGPAWAGLLLPRKG